MYEGDMTTTYERSATALSISPAAIEQSARCCLNFTECDAVDSAIDAASTHADQSFARIACATFFVANSPSVIDIITSWEPWSPLTLVEYFRSASRASVNLPSFA